MRSSHDTGWGSQPPRTPSNSSASGQPQHLEGTKSWLLPRVGHWSLRGCPTSQTVTHSDLATASTGDPVGPLNSRQPMESSASKQSLLLNNIPEGGQPCESLHPL